MSGAKLIAAVQGASTLEIQALFRAFVATLVPATRVVGVIQESGNDADRGAAELRNLVDGRRHRIFQDLGPGSMGCGLDAGSVVTACEAVRRDIAAGCDLVVLGKFGRLESERTGLADAFADGVAAQKPILTSVAPKFDAAWADFAAPLFVRLPPDLSAIREWWLGFPTAPFAAVDAPIHA